MIWSMIRSTRDHFFNKRSCKLDFLNTVLLTITDYSEKTKMKKLKLHVYGLCISSSFNLLISLADFFKICSLYPIFLKLHFPLQKKGWDWEGVENYVYSSKNLYNNIWLSLCVLVAAWSMFDLFLMFLMMSAMFDMVFHKNSELPFLWPNKIKGRQ